MEISSSISEGIQNIIGNNPQAEPEVDFFSFISSPRFYLSIVVFAIAVGLWVLLRKFIRHYNQKILDSEIHSEEKAQKRTVFHILASIMKVVIVVGAIIAFLQVQGINVSSLVAGVSIIAAIIGFATQDAIKDVIGGMYIIADHYFAVGDVITYKNDEGEVIYMSIRTTKIRSTVTGNIITISNRSFTEACKVSDWWDIDLGLSYDEDPRHIHGVLGKLCEDIAKIKGISRCEYKGTNSFGESSVIYKIRCVCEPVKKYEMRRAALKVIQDGLGRENIHIPYNHLNVILKDGKRS